jgi:beta-glucosidase
VVKANPNTVVVLITGTPVEMSQWIANVRGLLYTSYLGMETGTALTRIIAGEVNPSGKLPYTLPVRLEDTGPYVVGEYPGKDGKVVYNDDIYVGYRYFDTKKVNPLFPFGYGLSYTTFAYENLKVETTSHSDSLRCVVSFDIRNTGNVDGKEIAQVYVSDIESRLPRPLKELKGFAKVALKKGECRRVSVEMDRRAFQYYDHTANSWILEPGRFEILVGSSASSILLRETIEL